MIETIAAAVVLAVCLLLLARLCLGARRRQRVDAALRRVVWLVKLRVGRLRHWRERRRAEAQAAVVAAREAEALIRRARASAERDGNVIRPRAFRREPGEPRKPH